MTPSDLIMQLLGPEGRTDPYPLYSRLREHGQLVVVDANYLVATSYSAVDAMLRDPRLYVEETTLLLGQPSVLYSNPPSHTRMRRLIAGAFTPRRVNGLRESITAQAHALADAMRDKGKSADLMQDFAYQLPVGVICELLGVPAKDRAWFRPVAADYSVVLEGTFTEPEAAAAQSAADLLRAYFADLVKSGREGMAADLAGRSGIAAGRSSTTAGEAGRNGTAGDLAAPDGLSEAELLGNLALLLIAGFETTTNLIGNGVMLLLGHPDQLARLTADPGLAEPFVEEFLRFDSPVQLTSRYAAEATVLEGQTISPGTYVMGLIGAANRDPAKFVNADQFDPDRTGNIPISFGAGAHFCLGAALARLEAQIAFPLLLNRFPGLALAGEPIRRSRLVLRGYESLPVTWT